MKKKFFFKDKTKRKEKKRFVKEKYGKVNEIIKLISRKILKSLITTTLKFVGPILRIYSEMTKFLTGFPFFVWLLPGFHFYRRAGFLF